MAGRPKGRFALWWKPAGKLRRRLVRKIRVLSRQFATPSFEPHVTLLGGVTGREHEVASKTATLAKLLRPFTIRLADLGYQDEYFRCLFARVVDTAPVVRANRLARHVFPSAHHLPYMPHLSLVYGKLAKSTKQQIISKLAQRLDSESYVKTLYLYSIEGEPREWRRVKGFRLK